MTDTLTRYQKWRLANPDKVRAQRQRKKARERGELPAYVPPPKKPEEELREKQRTRMTRWHKSKLAKMAKDPEYAKKERDASRIRARRYFEKLRADPVAYAAMLEKKRNQKRLAKGIPLDAPVRKSRLTDEEREESNRRRAAANRERKRIKYRLENGLPVDAPGRKVAKKKEAEKRSKAKERADRSAMIAEIMARPVVKESLTPALSPDPPALQELFRKAAKGEPVRPVKVHAKKRSVFQLRGIY